jgi:tetratricopeptide (TPR) repeat protein
MIEIEGIAGKLALLAPIAVLAIVVWRTGRRPAAPGPDEHRMLKRTSDAPLGVMSPSVFNTLDALEAEASATESVEAPAVAKRAPAVAEKALPAAIDLAPQPSPPVDWPTLIAEAAEKGDNAALASAHLAYAKSEIAEGRNAQAGDQLRACLQFAARTRDRALQAEARLELAELSRADGDLTTACEHWQSARALVHDLSSKRELDETEKLMRTHGCPTDWVLNDF